MNEDKNIEKEREREQEREVKHEEKRHEYKDEERGENPFVNMLRGIWVVIKVPFRLLVSFARMLNEIRVFILSVVTIVIFGFIALLLIVIFKPPFAWEPLKDFLNAELRIESGQAASEDDLYKRINKLVVDTAQNTDQASIQKEIKLSSADMTLLFQKAGIIKDDSVVSIEKDLMRIYMNIDSKEKPLWLLINLCKNSDGNVKVDEVAFKRFSLPGFVAGAMNSSFSSLTDVLAKQNSKTSSVILLNQVLDNKKISTALSLERVDFIDGYVVLAYKIQVKN
jgi:hypothetical protein